MNTRPPTMRKHQQGYYFVRWGGRDHYLGKDREDAERLYLQSLQQWSEWRAERNTKRLPPLKSQRTIAEVFDRFIKYKELEGGSERRLYYAKHLKRFVRFFGDARADIVKAQHVHALKEHMMKERFAPKTINHDITSVKTMLNWGSSLGLLPELNLHGVKVLPLGPPPDKSVPLDTVKEMVHGSGKPLAPWLAINYLCAMRPSEVVKVVNGQGSWISDGVFRLDRGKMDLRSSQFRHILFTRESLAWLEQCEPVWSRLDSYSAACRRTLGNGGPGILRHSAATHLEHSHNVPRLDVEAILGHALPRISVTYHRLSLEPLRVLLARLTLG